MLVPLVLAASLMGGPSVPAGYSQTYAHNFETQGMGDWVTQPGAGAQVSVSRAYGLGIGITGKSQWAEVISSDAVIGPNAFIRAQVYAPRGGNGQIANWIALWTTGNPWPQNGEIDALEGGNGCFQVHYGTSADVINSPQHCDPVTGWHTISVLRTGEQVTVWYDSTEVGTESLPTNANEELIFQNQSGPDQCAACTGPFTRSTAALASIAVWS